MYQRKIACVQGLRQALAALLICAFCWCAPVTGADAADIVTANGHVYMRKGPSTKDAIIVVLQPDSELKVQGTSGDWYKVTYGNKRGYVRQDVVTPLGQKRAETVGTDTGTGAATAVGTSYRTLKKGMSGNDVFTLQEGLIYAGFFDRMPDGKYGDNTVEAVKAYQKDNKLKADGIAGDETQRKLLGEPGTSPAAVATAVATGEEGDSSADASASTSSLKLGSKGDAVRELQTQLKALGFLSSNPDGNFGSKTEEAVVAFQKANKLKADGVAGSATQNAIYSSKVNSNTAVASTGTTNASTVLKEGSKGEAVKQMQTALKNLGYYNGSLTGNFGSLTGDAVRAFQKANKLSNDGVAGATTLNKLYGGSAVAKSGGTGDAGMTNTVSAAGIKPAASSVLNVNWYTMRPKYKAGTIVTVYDFHTGLSWKCQFMSLGKHADSDPLTSNDTEIMYRAFGNKNTWTAKSVWVTMPDGKTYIGSLHNMPHLSGKIRDNNFPGHLCIHFPRKMEEAEATGPYAVSHQVEINKGWAETQRLAGR